MKASDVSKARRRGSSSFSLESHLVDSLKRQLRKLLENTRYGDEFEFFSELPVGAIIPDLMVVRLPRGTRPMSGRKCQVPVLDGFVLSALLDAGPLSGDEIANRLFTRPKRIAPCLRRLESMDIVVSSEEEYALRPGTFLHDAQIVAIEAKLTRWKEAIEQANAYLGFANQSYVALPEDIVEGVSGIVNKCEDAGVGLISVRGDSICIAAEAQFSQIYTPGWSWVVLRSIFRKSFGFI